MGGGGMGAMCTVQESRLSWSEPIMTIPFLTFLAPFAARGGYVTKARPIRPKQKKSIGDNSEHFAGSSDRRN